MPYYLEPNSGFLLVYRLRIIDDLIWLYDARWPTLRRDLFLK